MGCLIPDRLYSPDIEGYGIDLLSERFGNFKKLFREEDVQFLSDLQFAHDAQQLWLFQPGPGLPPEVREHLESVAETYSLNAAVLFEPRARIVA
jgi:hypothetical protein